ncbi:hypothetical protein PGH26_08470 [Sporosarcina jeotgali]|uniref:Permease n=1 Tax=Sporosarcina jeotgali TaxID=3020056 RepID=A0ABZ0KUJ7_9BACL|nr:hypothetical protein [Sporosarcina sp. B2O-1]WOV82977.1 hypothetical protein PGH26_08470 [Sporosarcina sp. B2O-1]
MKHKDLILMALILLSITALMAYDFFPQLSELLFVPKPLIIMLLLLILFSGYFVTRLQHDGSQKFKFLWQVAFTTYLLALLIGFTLLGGVSQVGISLSSPALWIVLVISLFEIYQEYKKLPPADHAS